MLPKTRTTTSDDVFAAVLEVKQVLLNQGYVRLIV